MTRGWLWWWRRQRARHAVHLADLAYRRWPSPDNAVGYGLAASHLRQVEINRP